MRVDGVFHFQAVLLAAYPYWAAIENHLQYPRQPLRNVMIALAARLVEGNENLI